MNINLRDLSLLTQEYNTLTNKMRMTKADEKRCAYLQTAISAVKSGATLAEVDVEFHNERSRAAGLSEVTIANRDRETEARGWQQFIHNGKVESRDMVEGSISPRVGTYTSMGQFVPTDFFPQLFSAMKAHDALFDENSGVTFIRSTNGRPLPVPVAGDTESTAVIVGEAGSQSSVDIDSTEHVVLGANSYASDRFVASMEAFQDVEQSLSLVSQMKKFFADKLARGIGADLMNGNGSSKTLGLIPALTALGVTPVIAAGSAANDGGSNTGANSLGTPDLQAAVSALDSAYIGPSTRWLMNHKTFAALSGQLDKYGNVLNLVRYVDGEARIFGIPVAICPSMDDIGASKTPVVLGDLSYWATRVINDETSGLVVYKEAPGLVEQGNVGIRCFVRAFGGLLYTDTSSPSPFIPIQNHS